MRVMSRGDTPPPEEWTMQVYCTKAGRYDNIAKSPDSGCGAELQISFDDVVVGYGYGTHFYHDWPYVQCPLCLRMINIPDIPDPIWDLVQTTQQEKGIKPFETGIDHSF